MKRAQLSRGHRGGIKAQGWEAHRALTPPERGEVRGPTSVKRKWGCGHGPAASAISMRPNRAGRFSSCFAFMQPAS